MTLARRKVCSRSLSRVRLSATPWTVACQAPLSMGFPKQRYWSRLPCSPPGDLPNPGIKPASPETPALAGGFFTTSTTGQVWHKDHVNVNSCSTAALAWRAAKGICMELERWGPILAPRHPNYDFRQMSHLLCEFPHS